MPKAPSAITVSQPVRRVEKPVVAIAAVTGNRSTTALEDRTLRSVFLHPTP